MPKRTPLYDLHTTLGARIVDFHGWDLPVQYTGILAEHVHCRTAASLFDTSHMGQVLIQAPAASLNRVTTQNAATLAVGRARYGFLLSQSGGILDDTILMRLADEEFLLVVNAGTQAEDLALVCSRLGSGDATSLSAAGWAKLDLQGPASAAVLAPVTAADLDQLAYFHVARTVVCGHDCILSRTGYTGELGYEVFAPAEALVDIFSALVEHPLVEPAGLGARDSLRLEMGYPLYGNDISASTTPFEACLGAFLSFDHDFVGASALALADAPSRSLVAFAADTRRRAWEGDPICRDGTEVGQVTSAAFGPSLGVSIGMGYVSAALSSPGQPLSIRTGRGDLSVTITRKPLYTQGTRRTKELRIP